MAPWFRVSPSIVSKGVTQPGFHRNHGQCNRCLDNGTLFIRAVATNAKRKDGLGKPLTRPHLHVCFCGRENMKGREVMCINEGLFGFLCFPRFWAKSATKGRSGSYCVPRFFSLCCLKMLEAPLKLRGDDDKNWTRGWRREDGSRGRVWSDWIFFPCCIPTKARSCSSSSIF